jgi:hypothetical protein
MNPGVTEDRETSGDLCVRPQALQYHETLTGMEREERLSWRV